MTASAADHPEAPATAGGLGWPLADGVPSGGLGWPTAVAGAGSQTAGSQTGEEGA